MKYKISHIFEGIELTEDQKQKIDESFGLAIQTKIDEIESLNEDYRQEMIQTLEEQNKEYLKEHVHGYFEDIAKTAVHEFITEKTEQIDTVVQMSVNESLLADLKNIFEKHGFTTPEMVTDKGRLDEANERIDDLIAESKHKDKQIETLKKQIIVESLLVDLTESQKDRVYDDMMDVVLFNENQFITACENILEDRFGSSEGKTQIDESFQNNQQQSINWSFK